MKVSKRNLVRMIKLTAENNAVPFLMGKPGIGKTAIIRQIAQELGWQLIDLRLSTMDETNMGEFPYLNDQGDYKSVDFAIPNWANQSNMQPTLIFFDELNRAPQNIIAAALKILREREIGTAFKFNSEVYMVAAGNLGAEDGTQVEDLDSAMTGRLARIDYELPFVTWKKDFADEHVNPYIVSFIETNIEWYYKFSEEGKAYPSPRSWENISKFVGNESTNLSQILSDVIEVGDSYIGNGSASFIYWLEEQISNGNKLTLKAVLNDFDNIKSLLVQAGTIKNSEISSKVTIDMILEWNDKQYQNFIKYMLILSDEVKTIIMSKIIDKVATMNAQDRNSTTNERYMDIFRTDKDLVREIGANLRSI